MAVDRSPQVKTITDSADPSDTLFANADNDRQRITGRVRDGTGQLFIAWDGNTPEVGKGTYLNPGESFEFEGFKSVTEVRMINTTGNSLEVCYEFE